MQNSYPPNNQKPKSRHTATHTLKLTHLEKHMKYQFDYEINSIKLVNDEELNCKMYYFDKNTRNYSKHYYVLSTLITGIVNYHTFKDNKKELSEGKITVMKKINKAWCLKRLVSKNKRRFENEQFDLDMVYVTEKVIAMGYPATGFEKIYRNSIDEVIRFFHIYHNDNVKIYNLCLEKDRIYEKTLFPKSDVGLFPATDHNPCPIKLILEFCVDICLYLIKNPEAVAAVHCKAGKGRTGVMICSYLIFSGLCKNSEEAFNYYGAVRTYNKKGVTIPSQIRYTRYFETFLISNFCPPYIFLIPKIVKYHINQNTTNILKNFTQDKSYFISPNEFILNSIKVGPITSDSSIDIRICDFVNENVKLSKFNKKFTPVKIGERTWYFFEMTFNEKIKIDSDIKISLSGGVSFYVWVNLWYSSWDNIRKFFDNYQEKNNNQTRVDDVTCAVDAKKPVDFSKENPTNTKAIEMANFTNYSHRKIGMEEFIEIKENKHEAYNQLSESEDEREDKKSKVIGSDNLNEKISPSNNQPGEQTPNISEFNDDDDLFEIIFKLKHNTNLNVLLNQINLLMQKRNKPFFDRNNMTISLSAVELDKFSNAKKMNKAFEVTIGYSLVNES